MRPPWDGTRRLPWVTFGILGLCALAFFLTDFGGSRSEWEAVESHERAIGYWAALYRLDLDAAGRSRLEALA